MFAAHGAVLDVDLARGTVQRVALDPEDVRRFIGGSGWSCAQLLREGDPADIDPLGPENTLHFIVGTLVGTGAPATPKVIVSAKSPLTGIWGEAAAGGNFPAMLKRAGVDGVVVRGQAETPVYLLVDEDGGRLLPADDLWGQDTFAVHDELCARHGRKGRGAVIGPAGESLVRFASVMCDGVESRAAGRCGMGAVMGSKRLKAIFALGSRKPELFDPAGLKASVKGFRPELLGAVKGLTDWSTAGGVEAVEHHGDLPVKNWQLGAWTEGAQKIAAQGWFDKYFSKHGTCNLCPIRCHKWVKIDEGEYAGAAAHGPEYETLAGFGSNLLIDQPEPIVRANELCNRLGLDTISCAGVVGFAFEAFDKGLIDEADTGGPLRWGDGAALVRLVEMIGRREGIGRLLGEGSKRAAQEIGGGSERFTIEVKGLELPYHDPRAHVSMAPNYATSSRGACHLDSLSYFIGRGVPAPDLGYTEPFKDHVSSPDMARLCYLTQNYQSMFNPLGLCKFLFVGRAGPSKLAEWIHLATGWEMDTDGYMEAGERLLQLKRIYNVRAGVRREHDTLPYRLLNEPQPDGMAAGVVPDLPVMLDALYRLRGWDADGALTAETVAKFGLDEFAGS